MRPRLSAARISIRLPHLIPLPSEPGLLDAICKLRQLQQLHLVIHLDPAATSPDRLRPYAAWLCQLNALAALVRLHLELPDCCQSTGDSWARRAKDGDVHQAWEGVREQLRTSLLSALRCMPQLQHLQCPTLVLQPAEAASLTALTSLTLATLQPPELLPNGGSAAPAPAPASAAPGRASAAAPRQAAGMLFPQLQALTLTEGASPRTLAALAPLSSLTSLKVSCIRFGMSDVAAGCRVRPEAVEAFEPAMQLLAERFRQTHVVVRADCGEGPMEPRGGKGRLR